jgi:hypothetical protein
VCRQLVTEALALQREGATAEMRADATWREADATLEVRREAAAEMVNSLTAERKRCASELERRTRRIEQHARSLGDAAHQAMPVLTKRISIDGHVARADARRRSLAEETARAKASVKLAMQDLENISLDIQRQRAQPPAAAPASDVTDAAQPEDPEARASDHGLSASSA